MKQAWFATTGFRAGVLHIVCHGFSKATLFLCAGAVAYVTGTRSISALGGLAKTMPLTATAFFVGVLGVAEPGMKAHRLHPTTPARHRAGGVRQPGGRAQIPGRALRNRWR